MPGGQQPGHEGVVVGHGVARQDGDGDYAVTGR